MRQGMEKKYILQFLTSLSGWKERWFYVGNHKPALPEMIARSPKITYEWTMSPRDMSQINDLRKGIMKLRKEGVTGALVVYLWIGWHIQSLQKRTHLASSTSDS
jgi:hypothetical protein